MIPKIKLNNLEIQRMPVGLIAANCYLIFDKDSRKCLIIDPGDEFQKLEKIIRDSLIPPQAIIITHGHFDHTGAALALKNAFNCPTFMNWRDKALYFQPTENLAENQIFTLGLTSFKIVETPGHSPGAICLFTPGLLFSGDTLFAGGFGRYDLPGASELALKKSLKKIFEIFPEETLVLPGHGETTTLGAEKALLAGFFK